MSMITAARVLAGARVLPLRRPPDGPLRIVMSTETIGLGGAEVVMLELAEELQRRGHTVFPVAPKGRDGWLRRRFIELAYPWNSYELRRATDWSCVEGLASLYRELRADVAHGHEFTASVYGVAASRLVGIPHVSTMHGNQQMTQRLRARVALRWAFRHGDHSVAVSGDTQRHLEQTLGLPASSLRVVLNGIPDRRGDRDGTRGRLGIRHDDLLVLAVGSLMKRKGHLLLLQAMTMIDARGGSPRWRIAIAGEGGERDPLEQFISEHGLAERVTLLGNRDDVPDLLAAADVFVMPSLWEGLPLAVLEAMFARKPIIATTASGIPEALTHGEHGLLVPANDVRALADALGRLLASPDERATLGERARAQAEARFSIKAMTDAYERLYRAGGKS